MDRRTFLLYSSATIISPGIAWADIYSGNNLQPLLIPPIIKLGKNLPKNSDICFSPRFRRQKNQLAYIDVLEEGKGYSDGWHLLRTVNGCGTGKIEVFVKNGSVVVANPASPGNGHTNSADARTSFSPDHEAKFRCVNVDSVEEAKAWNATRIEWSYAPEPFLKMSTQFPYVGATINASWEAKTSGATIDIEGNPVFIPWLKKYGTAWASTNMSVVKEKLITNIAQWRDAGVTGIQIDDPQFQYPALTMGADFNQEAINKFEKDFQIDDYLSILRQAGIRNRAEYIQAFRSGTLPKAKEWKQFHRASVINFHEQVNDQFQKLTFSQNFYALRPKAEELWLAGYSDYICAEASINNSPALAALNIETGRSVGLQTVVVVVPPSPLINKLSSTQKTREAIALYYALGASPMVPWDIYMGGHQPDPGRYFGSRRDFFDLYKFVHSNAMAFDGHHKLAVVGLIVDPDEYDSTVEKNLLSLIDMLMNRHIPFIILLPELFLKRAPVLSTKPPILVKVDKASGANASEYLKSLPNEWCAAQCDSAPGEIFITPRFSANRKSSLFIVNRQSLGTPLKPRKTSIKLNPAYLPKGKLKILVLAPEGEKKYEPIPDNKRLSISFEMENEIALIQCTSIDAAA